MKTKRAVKTVFLTLAVCAALVSMLVGYTTASITTDQKLYSVGQTMTVNGTGFSTNAQITLTVLRPDKITDYVTGVFTDGSGNFTATYTPSVLEPGRYMFTDTDGQNSANTASTEADAISYGKGVYNKGALVYNDTTGGWTTGNAGKNYTEDQWAYYQYNIAGVGNSAATTPSFDVTYDFFQSATHAAFVDAFANFRICIDCDLSDPTDVGTGGLLNNGIPYPGGGASTNHNCPGA